MGFFSIPSSWVKALRLAAAVGASAGFVACYTLDLWAQRRLAYFESAFSEAMKRPVSIDRSGFSPWRGFYFENFSVQEHKTAPRPLRIGRLEAHASVILWPEPTLRVHRLVMDRPEIGIDVHPEDLFRSQLWLKRVPYLETRIGRLRFEARLQTVQAHEGRIALFSPQGVRQDFDQIRFFAGKKGWTGQVLEFEGRVADRPQAQFKIRCRIRPGLSGGYQTEARADFREFTGAYLSPFLAGRFQLPDRHLTGSLNVTVHSDGRVRVQGRLALPEAKTIPWAPWEPKPFEARIKITGKRHLDQVLFEEIGLRAAGITVSGSGSAVWRKGHEKWQAALSARRVPVDRIPKKWSAPWHFQSGTVDLHFSAEADAKHYTPDLRLSLSDVRIENRQAGVVLDRLGGQAIFGKSLMALREAWFFYNGVPVRMSGMADIGRGRIALEGQTYPGQLESLKTEDKLYVSFRVASKRTANGWSGAARVRVDNRSGLPATHTLSFRHAALKESAPGRLQARSGRLLVRSDGSPYAPAGGPIRIDAAGLELQYSDGPLRLKSNARLAGGRFFGNAQWDKTSGLRARLFLRNADAGVMAERLRLKHPVTGRFDGAVSVGIRLGYAGAQGHFRVRDGAIGPSDSLRKLSDETGILALCPIRFDRLYGRFRWDGAALDLDEWKLEGKDLWLSAEARIGAGAMVGRLTARIPLRVVSASSGLAWLARYVGESEEIDFDFRIAGNPQRPRAHWMAGTFRDKIEKRLAPWVQAEFSRQIRQKFSEPATPRTA